MPQGREDLLLALGLVAIAMTIGVFVGLRAGRLFPRPACVALAALSVGLTVIYLAWGRESSFWTRLIPWSNVIVLSNPTPWLAAILAGLFAAQPGIPRWRRVSIAVTMLVAGAYVPTQTAFRRPPPTMPAWTDKVALQSTASTCTPAAAASLLQQYGIDASERTMAELCLTNRQGTPQLGLYRGLVIAAASKGLSPQMHWMSVEQLIDQPDLLPAIVSVRLTRQLDQQDPRYSQRWGWLVGVRHSVVFFAINPDQTIDVGDPGVGREQWNLRDIRKLWVGDVTTLQPR